jgi:hypothetical protein
VDKQLLEQCLEGIRQRRLDEGSLMRDLLCQAHYGGFEDNITPSQEQQYGERYREELRLLWGEQYANQRLSSVQNEQAVDFLLNIVEDEHGLNNSALYALGGTYHSRPIPILVALVQKYIRNGVLHNSEEETALCNILYFLEVNMFDESDITANEWTLNKAISQAIAYAFASGNNTIKDYITGLNGESL